MSSGFVTETEIEERRQKRQEEWEKVRKPEDPQTAPDEPVDNRSLFERLEEQRQKKELDWEEEHKFKNQVRGLDDDEVDFLDKIDDMRTESERQRLREERQELLDYDQKRAELREKELQERLRSEIKGPEPRKNSNRGSTNTHGNKSLQQRLILGAVKRKSSESGQEKTNEGKKSKNGETNLNTGSTTPQPAVAGSGKPVLPVVAGSGKPVLPVVAGSGKPVVPVVAGSGVLLQPGKTTGLLGLLGEYGSDSDTE